MGGGGKKKGGIGGAIGGAVGGLAKGMGTNAARYASYGLYDPNTGSVGTGNVLENIGSIATSSDQIQGVQEGILGKPEDMPKELDPAVLEARIKADEKRKFEDTYGGNKAGLASTLLGGSISTDTGVLKKKKLLGE